MSRPSRIRFFALALSGVLAAIGVVTMSTSANAAPLSITGGTMDWGVKESFRNYVQGGFAAGNITVHDGATKNSNGTFRFPFQAGGTYDEAANALDVPHAGGVKFQGHGTVLEVDIYNLRIKTTATGVFMYADATSRPFDNPFIPAAPKSYSNVPIMAVNMTPAVKTASGNQVTWAGATTKLTPEGVPVFGGFYDAGTDFDPVTFTIATAAASTTTTTIAATTSTTVPGATTTTALGGTTTTTALAGTTTTTTAVVPTTSTTVAPTTTTTAVTTSTTGVPAPTTGTPITSGFLDWGLKTSFRTYVKGGIAKGTVTYGPPAAPNADESVRFPLNGTTGRRDASANRTGAPFGGSVHYVGHDGQLDLLVKDPRVAIDGSQGTLFADVVSKPLGAATATTYDDVALVSLDLTGITPTAVTNGMSWSNIPSTLTAQGAPAFAGFYTAGTAFDPVNMTIGLTGQVENTTVTTAAGPKINVVLGTPRPGGPVTVSGSGFVGGEQVQVAVLSTPRTLTTVTAAADGSVAPVTVTLPADLETGVHQIRLLGLFSNRSVLSQQFTVTRQLARAGSDTSFLAFAGAALLAMGVALSRLPLALRNQKS